MLQDRRRLTSRVHGSRMEAEQLHLVFLAFALPQLRACRRCLHDEARGRRPRESEEDLPQFTGSGRFGRFAIYLTDGKRRQLLVASTREHLDVRWQMNMASFCLRTKASFVPSRSPMHHAALFAKTANLVLELSIDSDSSSGEHLPKLDTKYWYFMPTLSRLRSDPYFFYHKVLIRITLARWLWMFCELSRFMLVLSLPFAEA